MPKLEKMSKSRGNVVTVDEVVYRVFSVVDGFEFRDLDNRHVDFQKLGVWRNRPGDSLFYSATKYGRRPIFLCHIGNPVPPMLLLNGTERLQHSAQIGYWAAMLKQYEAVAV